MPTATLIAAAMLYRLKLGLAEMLRAAQLRHRQAEVKVWKITAEETLWCDLQALCQTMSHVLGGHVET